MAASSLDLVLATADRRERRVIATLSWPAHLEADARAFIRDNLLAERLGDSRRAEAALQRGFVPASERGRFLAERPCYLPEPPAALAREIDLEDLVASFSTALQALRVADPGLELVFEWR
ncbi:MAG: hypothetical protein Q8L48_06330 [Archangium sp.]|nr:hypothetical protein [Archangium sp.]